MIDSPMAEHTRTRLLSLINEGADWCDTSFCRDGKQYHCRLPKGHGDDIDHNCPAAIKGM